MTGKWGNELLNSLSLLSLLTLGSGTGIWVLLTPHWLLLETCWAPKENTSSWESLVPHINSDIYTLAKQLAGLFHCLSFMEIMPEVHSYPNESEPNNSYRSQAVGSAVIPHAVMRWSCHLQYTGCASVSSMKQPWQVVQSQPLCLGDPSPPQISSLHVLCPSFPCHLQLPAWDVTL